MPFPLRTARLVLAPLGSDDRDAFIAYRQHPDVARWQSWTPDYSAADADRLIAGQPPGIEQGSGEWLQIGVRDRETGALLGDVAVHALADQPDTYEVGVTLAPAAQGRGVASEALAAIVESLFGEHGAHRVTATSDARNQPVARLLARVGFRHEGRALEADWFKGEWTSVDSWAILAGER